MDKLDDVERLREEYEASLDEAEARRQAYYRAIKKLNLSGVPLREIAEALGLSHQRVHQIVTGEATSKPGKRSAKGGAAVALVVVLVSVSGAVGFLLHRPPSPVLASNEVAIPNVVGLSVPAAQRLLEGNGVCVSGVTAKGTGLPRPVISFQFPSPGTLVDTLSSVSLQVPGPERTAIVLEPLLTSSGSLALGGFPPAARLNVDVLPPHGGSPARDGVRVLVPSVALPLIKPAPECSQTLHVFGSNITFTGSGVSLST